jgi:hypothetical protein
VIWVYKILYVGSASCHPSLGRPDLEEKIALDALGCVLSLLLP